MKKAYVFVFDGLADWEIALITFGLNANTATKVATIGFTRDPIRTGGGLKVLPDIALSELKPENTALLILPGGEMWHNTCDEQLKEVVLQLHSARVPIAGICAATVFLARVGIFKGVLHTSNSLEYLQDMVPEYSDQACYRDAYAVSDKGVITAGGWAWVEFTYQILKTMQVYDEKFLAEFVELFHCRDT